MRWIGERFFEVDGGWIDAATGRAIRLRLTDDQPNTAIAWNDECARLSRLRHPLLNPMLDFGAASRVARFEAYEAARDGPAAASAVAVDQVSGFLRAHQLRVDPHRAAFHVRPTRVQWNRMIGVLLQPRLALDPIEEALDRMTPPGPQVIHVRGDAGLGLRTFRDFIARAARIRGFVPVGVRALAAYPALGDVLRERHVCILDDSGTPSPPAPCAALIDRLAHTSTRRHVVVRLHREPAAGRRDIVLDRLDNRVLLSMVFVEGPAAPGHDELAEAARIADGRPGTFIDALTGSYPRVSCGAMTVHESAPLYAPDPPVIAGRLLGSAVNARPRAEMLARKGRHTAARRALTRAQRVLEGRDRPIEAAACALQLGWMALDRGRIDEALAQFDRAVALAPHSPARTAASVGRGVALVDADRLLEAEAVLRGALAGADSNTDVHASIAAALARCLYWQGRAGDAIAIAEPHRRADDAVARTRVLAIIARCEVRLGRIAVPTAREAQASAASGEDPRARASAELALAEALDGAGDTPGASAARSRAIRIARGSHLPLFRLRASLAARTDGADRIRSEVARRVLPPLLARRAAEANSVPNRRVVVEPVAEVETLLDLAQRAPDDASALGQVCRAVAARLGAAAVAVIDSGERTLAVEGRTWRAPAAWLKSVIACGTRVPPDGCREPQEAAEPVRYGGEVIGALACRWTAGASVDREGAAIVLRAAALSVAPAVRAVLDAALPPPPSQWGDILGDSPAAAALREAALRAGRAPFPVLIEGESGSGKELVARAIHRLGTRRDRRLCALNCAALTDDLIEAELFGHTRGAFTGAATERAGLFEEADGGTLFLDEVGELSARAQAKLLRVLQDGEVRRVGENLPRRVDVRVVAATNRSLEAEVSAGRFRADLRFRLDVVRIVVPPLRDRSTDIPLLATQFWRDASARVGSQATLSPEALAALARYDWPGNIRELQNVIAWIAVHSPRRGRVGPSALPAHVAQAATTMSCGFEAAREEFERRFIRAALAGANGRRSRAADALGVTRQGLAKMMRRLGIEAN